MARFLHQRQRKNSFFSQYGGGADDYARFSINIHENNSLQGGFSLL